MLTLYLWIRQEWTDAYLRWDPDTYGGLDAIRIPSSLVWRRGIASPVAIRRGEGAQRTLGSPIFPSGCEGKLGVALESLQGLRDLT